MKDVNICLKQCLEVNDNKENNDKLRDSVSDKTTLNENTAVDKDDSVERHGMKVKKISITPGDSSEKGGYIDRVCNDIKSLPVLISVEDELSSEACTQKINAFQYMMNNRHKSIGTNSPGKEIDSKTSINCNFDKEKLRGRKQLLEDWAEMKGASKRKRQYDEQGTYINYKLEKRAKKLKKMLRVVSHSDDELIVSKKRGSRIIESDNEDSFLPEVINVKTQEGTENQENKIKHKKRPLTEKKKSKTAAAIESDNERPNASSSPKQWKIKLNLVENKREKKASQGEQYDENNENNGNEIKVENEENNADCGRMVLRPRNPKIKTTDDEFVFSSDDELQTPHKKKHPLKLAPVFLKAVPKPKLDPEVVEARRQFLLSGVPESLRKDMEKQQSTEELDFDVFPAVSHVQQKTVHEFWHLPKVNIGRPLIDNEYLKIDTDSFSVASLRSRSVENHNKQEYSTLNKIKSYSKIIRDVKSQNPNYPVYKVFKSLYSRSGYRIEQTSETSENVKKEQKSPPKRRGRKKKMSFNKNTEIVNATQFKTTEIFDIHAMWTEKYKARHSDDIFGNRKSVKFLKEWLINWLTMISENKKKAVYDSESEFYITDSDSRDSTKSCNNTVILKGPHGSGKTSAVYAVCAELGLNVLEVNASSKRTGKWLLQEVQEATQSHQVRKKENIFSFVKERKEEKSTKRKMCLLLIEDVDIVFEQDEGFIAALMQVMATSKRPIILTTTDEHAINLQKILSYHKTISFSPFSSVLAVWLQIVCIIEGCFVKRSSLEKLLNYNRGDVRKTLLHLQYWVTSGGNVDENELENDNLQTEIITEELVTEDDNSNMSDLKLDESEESNIDIHCVSIDSLQTVDNDVLFTLPYCNNLETVWWNLPNILNLPNFSKLRLNRDDYDYDQTCKVDIIKEREKLSILSKFYDSLAFTDIIYERNQFHESLARMWQSKLKDSLVLEENMSEYNDVNFSNDIIDTIINSQIKIYKEKFEPTYSTVNMALPPTHELKWRSKQISCEEKLKEALLDLNYLERKSVALDYMPALRSIVRSEVQRAVNGTKRRSRFYSYLRNLGIYNEESVYKTISNIFKVEL